MKTLNLMRIDSISTMKSSICLVLATSLFYTAIAQGGPNASTRDTSSVIEEKLVQLAFQGPELQKMAHQIKIDEYQLRAAQNAWMNLLAFNINYNEFTFKQTGATPYIYPRYNLGITIPLGTLFSRTAVKSANENVEIGKNNTEELKRDLRQRVLSAYKEYVSYGQLISIQNELSNDMKTLLAQVEEKFRAGSVSIDAYNSVQKSNSMEIATLINLRLQQDLKKLELEKLIGTKLETALRSR
jgi:outer membrane protein TolC